MVKVQNHALFGNSVDCFVLRKRRSVRVPPVFVTRRRLALQWSIRDTNIVSPNTNKMYYVDLNHLTRGQVN